MVLELDELDEDVEHEVSLDSDLSQLLSDIIKLFLLEKIIFLFFSYLANFNSCQKNTKS